MRLSYKEVWQLLDCWQKKLNVQQTMRITKFSERTVRIWQDKFRKHLPSEPYYLQGEVEIDELYVSRNIGVFGALERQSGRIVLWVPPERPDKHTARIFLDSAVHPKSWLYTDGSPFYKKVIEWGFARHFTERHYKFEFGKTSRIEGIWGVFRTFIRRMYHHIWSKNLRKFVAEFQARFCHRKIFENPLNYFKKCLSCVPT